MLPLPGTGKHLWTGIAVCSTGAWNNKTLCSGRCREIFCRDHAGDVYSGGGGAGRVLERFKADLCAGGCDHVCIHDCGYGDFGKSDTVCNSQKQKGIKQ